jgi:DNA-binding PadR family transcriptional regulator
MVRTLNRFERALLQAVSELGSGAYGVPVRLRAEELHGSSTSLGWVYVTMARLEKEGLAASQLKEGGPERRGMPKRCWWLTGDGRRALEGE